MLVGDNSQINSPTNAIVLKLEFINKYTKKKKTINIFENYFKINLKIFEFWSCVTVWLQFDISMPDIVTFLTQAYAIIGV